VDDDIEQMKHDGRSSRRLSSTSWVSPELIYNLMMSVAERAIEQTTSKASE